jgi:hypothetical protein
VHTFKRGNSAGKECVVSEDDESVAAAAVCSDIAKVLWTILLQQGQTDVLFLEQCHLKTLPVFLGRDAQ